jgi:hypothetical protein
MTTMLEDLQSATATAAGPLQGSVVWWDLSDSETAVSLFTQRIRSEGLDETLLPEQPPPARALRDAGQETLKGHGNKKGMYLLRPAGTSGDTYFYAMVREDQVSAGTLHHGQSATFSVRPDGMLSVTVHDPACRKDAAAVEAAYLRIHGTYQSRDIREFVLRTLKAAAGVPLRSHGGIYWVPASFQDVVEKVKRVIDSLGQSAFSILPIHATALGTRAVSAAAKRHLEEELTTLKQELDGWSMDLAHGEGPRPSTVHRRIEDFVDLRSKAHLYRDILSLQVEDIEARLIAAEQQAKKILLGIDIIRS